jgi:hypothetical protein
MTLHLSRILEDYPAIVRGPIVWDRRRPSRGEGRRTAGYRAVRQNMPLATLVPRSPVFKMAFETAHFPLAPQPLALAVAGPLDGRPTLVATVGGGHPRRIPRWLIATGTITKNLGMPGAA